MLSSRKLSCLALAVVFLTLTARAEGPTPVPVPGATDVLIVLNVRKALDSGLFKKYGADIVKVGLGMKESQDVIAATGINPLKDIDSIMVAGKAEMNSKAGVLVVKGKFDEEKIKTFADAESKKGTFKFKSSKEGTATIHELTLPNMPETIFLTFADKSTLLVGAEKEFILKVASGKTDKPSAKFGALLSKITGKETLAVALIATDDLKNILKSVGGMEEIAPKLESAILTVNVADGVDAKAVIAASDSDTVGAIKFVIGSALTTAKASLGTNKDLQAAVGKVKVTSDKTAVTVSLVLTAADVQKLAASK